MAVLVALTFAASGCGGRSRTSSTTGPPASTQAAATAPQSSVPGDAGADVVFDGTGNLVLDVSNPSGTGAPYVVRVTNRGPGAFVSVEGLSADGLPAGYATKASATDGVQVFDAFDPATSRYGSATRLQVEAATPDTSWEVRLVALRNVPEWDPTGPAAGTGDAVVQVPAGVAAPLDVTTTVTPPDRPLMWTFYRPGPGEHLDKAGDATDAGEAVVPSGSLLVSVQGSMGLPYDWTIATVP